MRFKPIIGIVSNIIPDARHPGWTYYANREQDISAITAAGGLPVILPPAVQANESETIIDSLDGLYLAGGGDLDGVFYDRKGNPLILGVNRARDAFELGLSQIARSRQMPILGICRGCQVLNVAAGGSLVVDIPSSYKQALRHDTDPEHPLVSHPVEIDPASRLGAIYQTGILSVNSYHHQAVLLTGRALAVTAKSPDGIIEGIEAVDHPFYVGVQWHPERAEGNQAGIEKIFTSFVQAAQQYHSL